MKDFLLCFEVGQEALTSSAAYFNTAVNGASSGTESTL